MADKMGLCQGMAVSQEIYISFQELKHITFCHMPASMLGFFVFRMREQKPLQVIAGKKKQCAMTSIVASFVSEKRDVLLDLVGINCCICGISIDPDHPSDVFDVGYVPFERSPEAAISRRRSVSCNNVNVNKPKLRISIDRWGCLVISSEDFDVGNMSSL